MPNYTRNFASLLAVSTAMFMTFPVMAGLTDLTQTPNAVSEGIHKSLFDQIGAGRGDVNTPYSSVYIIERDPFRAIRRGRQLFQRKFRMSEGLGPRNFDGVGDLNLDGSLGAGLADSCAACHGRPRGAAGFGGEVFTRPDSRDAPHLFGLGLQEMLADEITGDLRTIRERAVAAAVKRQRSVTRALKSKGIDYGAITAHPDGSVDTANVQGVNEDLRVRPFFAEGGTISIREFVAGAFNAEMGMEAADDDLNRAANGADVVTPSGMVLSGSQDRIEAAAAQSIHDDPDGDGNFDEVPASLVDFLEFYLLNYFAPATGRQGFTEARGERLVDSIGCTSCHVPNLRIEKDRRVADVRTVYDPKNGVFNSLFATATANYAELDDGSGYPTRKLPAGDAFLVQGIYTDFKRHDLGPAFWERNFDGSYQKEFMTEPLWGVGSTPPYGHDGRSIGLTEVILRHGGEAEAAKRRFERLRPRNQEAVLAFLRSLVLFPPDDTASNLNPGDPAAENFPQAGHGNIKLPVLFNDPSDPE